MTIAHYNSVHASTKMCVFDKWTQSEST